MSTASAITLYDNIFPDRSPHWDTPRSRGHSVQFYEEDSSLLDGLSRFIGAAIVAGEAALVVATKSHRDELAARLRNRGLDLRRATSEGRFLSIDSAKTLERFTVDGVPHPTDFHRLIGSLIAGLASGGNGEV